MNEIFLISIGTCEHRNRSGKSRHIIIWACRRNLYYKYLPVVSSPLPQKFIIHEIKEERKINKGEGKKRRKEQEQEFAPQQLLFVLKCSYTKTTNYYYFIKKNNIIINSFYTTNYFFIVLLCCVGCCVEAKKKQTRTTGKCPIAFIW